MGWSMEGEFFTIIPECRIIDLMRDKLRIFLMAVDLLSKVGKFRLIIHKTGRLLCTFALFCVETLGVSHYILSCINCPVNSFPETWEQISGTWLRLQHRLETMFFFIYHAGMNHLSPIARSPIPFCWKPVVKLNCFSFPVVTVPDRMSELRQSWL